MEQESLAREEKAPLGRDSEHIQGSDKSCMKKTCFNQNFPNTPASQDRSFSGDACHHSRIGSGDLPVRREPDFTGFPSLCPRVTLFLSCSLGWEGDHLGLSLIYL